MQLLVNFMRPGLIIHVIFIYLCQIDQGLLGVILQPFWVKLNDLFKMVDGHLMLTQLETGVCHVVMEIFVVRISL